MPARIPFEGALDFALEKSRQLGAVFPQATVVVCLAMLAAATFGIQRLQLETDFSRNFRDDSKIVRSLQFVETNLGPAGTWEVCFDVPEEITDTVLNQVRELTISIRKAARPETTVLSISDLCYLPLFRSRPASTFRRMSKRRPKIAAAMHNQNQQRMRILLKSVEQQPSETKLAEIASVRKAVSDFFRANSATQTSGLQPTASGMFVLLAEVIQSLLRDQLASFVIACLGICLCISIAFRSITLGLIALLPNIFPVAVVMGFLGWQGVPVNIGTAMITSVSMGLTVDSTIHYLTAYRRARHNQTLDQALKIAHEEAGRAVVFAHIALVCGFLVLTASRFIPLVYFGALLSLSMLGGIFGDLILLPSLLRIFDRQPVSDAKLSQS